MGNMYNPTEILIESFIEELRKGYRKTYGRRDGDYEDLISWAGSTALEIIASSDAVYHDVEHTILVTLVGQEILRGKHIRDGGVSPKDWVHFIISLVCHDIGYVKGICSQDDEVAMRFATGDGETFVTLPPGASDAALTRYHVDRGKLFVTERFSRTQLIDPEVVKANIELTRFPVPDGEDPSSTTTYPGLVRASDLIGQMSDPRYLKKIVALFYEFEEIGFNKIVGFQDPGDLKAYYPSFYWNKVYPYIKDATRYLARTQQGLQFLANLHSNVFLVEHGNFPLPRAITAQGTVSP